MTQALETLQRGELDKEVFARASDYRIDALVNVRALMAASRRVNLHCFHFNLSSTDRFSRIDL